MRVASGSFGIGAAFAVVVAGLAIVAAPADFTAGWMRVASVSITAGAFSAGAAAGFGAEGVLALGVPVAGMTGRTRVASGSSGGLVTGAAAGRTGICGTRGTPIGCCGDGMTGRASGVPAGVVGTTREAGNGGRTGGMDVVGVPRPAFVDGWVGKTGRAPDGGVAGIGRAGGGVARMVGDAPAARYGPGGGSGVPTDEAGGVVTGGRSVVVGCTPCSHVCNPGGVLAGAAGPGVPGVRGGTDGEPDAGALLGRTGGVPAAPVLRPVAGGVRVGSVLGGAPRRAPGITGTGGMTGRGGNVVGGIIEAPPSGGTTGAEAPRDDEPPTGTRGTVGTVGTVAGGADGVGVAGGVKRGTAGAVMSGRNPIGGVDGRPGTGGSTGDEPEPPAGAAPPLISDVSGRDCPSPSMAARRAPPMRAPCHVTTTPSAAPDATANGSSPIVLCRDVTPR